MAVSCVRIGNKMKLPTAIMPCILLEGGISLNALKACEFDHTGFSLTCVNGPKLSHYENARIHLPYVQLSQIAQWLIYCLPTHTYPVQITPEAFNNIV